MWPPEDLSIGFLEEVEPRVVNRLSALRSVAVAMLCPRVGSDVCLTPRQHLSRRLTSPLKQVDKAEGVILRMHHRYLLDPAEKIVASQEIVDTGDRVARTAVIIRRAGVTSRSAA